MYAVFGKSVVSFSFFVVCSFCLIITIEYLVFVEYSVASQQEGSGSEPSLGPL